ncbi:MAG TPA: xanthine dehydrogenase family protein molybdopterin-binding subunit [Burkholderiales bacterium]
MRFKGRREDDRLLTGKGKYTADWNLPAQLHAYFLRSDHPHAEIVSIEVPQTTAFVFTGKDFDCKTEPPLVKYPGKGGAMLKQPHRDVLAKGRVRFVGQEVALVVAETAAQAQDLAEQIEVEYRDLPAGQLYPDIPDDVCFEYEYGNEGAVKEAFSRAAHITRVTVESQRLIGNPMEPKAAVASYDASSGAFDLYVPTQGMSMMRAGLAAVTQVPPEKIRVHAHDVGGGFGIRSDAYAEYCVLMLAAKKLGRPIKWVASRTETSVSDYHGRAATLSGELALDREGNFLAININWLCDMGAYLSHPGPLINTLPPALHAGNLYRIPAIHGLHRLVLTNKVPTCPYRGAGRPNVAYLAERLVEEAARETGIDRIELRRRNLIPKEAFPYKTPIPISTYDSGDPAGLLDRVLGLSKWDAFPKRKEESKKRGKLRGIACSLFVEPAGAGGGPKEEVDIRFGSAGDAVIHALCGPSGQGHETVYPEVAAQIMGVDPERIALRAGDPDGPPLAGEGTIGSRSMMAHGGAIAVAAREIVRKAQDLAAKDLEVAAADLEFSEGVFRVRGTDLSVKMIQILEKHGSALNTKGETPQPRSFPSGAHVAEVEVDPATGQVEVLSYYAVDDCGRVINHALLEGQLHGGIVQGLGQGLGEHAVYDDSGQLLSASFMDYAMPRADEQPSIELLDHSIPSPNNPLGVKGAGEAGTTGAVPTVSNAVLDALRPLGIDRLEFPFSPSRVWSAIRDKRHS